jgi:2-polyprenyl-6-methoxyphenol hydroxylase-like FAD-dependent oxidoreductase
MNGRQHVAVVGFGAAGATVAILLARAGHHVTLFERAPQLLPVGAGILLQPAGQQVLAQMGLLQAIAETSEQIAEVHAVTHRGNDLVRLRYDALGEGRHALGVHRGDLFAVLERAARQAGVAIELGRCVDGIEDVRGEHGATLMAGGERFGPFDFVVAADGSRSRLRASCRLRHAVYPYAHAAMWAVGQCEAIGGKLFQVTRGTTNLCGLLPMGGGRCSLFWGLRTADRAALLARGFAGWRDDVLRLAPAAAEIFATVESFKSVAFAQYQHVWMPRSFTGRVVFLGDAAHAMSPHLGQGVGLAMVDAWSLARSIHRCRSVSEAFHHHANARRNQLRFYGAITLFMAPFFQSDGVVKGMGRDVALPVMTVVPALRRLMVRTMSGFVLE